MRTYILEILNKYKRYSEAWDIKRILCDKSWIVFNDSCDREIYIFHENGSLIQSRNGIVYSGSWQYVTANKSIVILSQGQAYMLHPYIFDNVFFVLQQDGTERYAFLMDEAKLRFIRHFA
jgi:hydroxymethylpyrimidine pyrophosphatase-like HAD family hydrolase